MTKTFLYVALAAMWPGITWAQAAPIDIKCPESPTVEESFTGVEPEWRSIRDEGKRGVHLASVSIYAGHPSRMASLTPNSVSVKNKKRTSLWQLPPANAEGYWIACNYANTLLMLARKVPDAARVCEVSETLLASGRSVSIDSVRCQ